MFLLGHALLATQQQENAVPFFERYVQLKPGDPDGHLALGYALYSVANDFERARKVLEESLRLKPDQVNGHYHLGMIAYQMGG